VDHPLFPTGLSRKKSSNTSLHAFRREQFDNNIVTLYMLQSARRPVPHNLVVLFFSYCVFAWRKRPLRLTRRRSSFTIFVPHTSDTLPEGGGSSPSTIACCLSKSAPLQLCSARPSSSQHSLGSNDCGETTHCRNESRLTDPLHERHFVCHMSTSISTHCRSASPFSPTQSLPM
jgi:hypothetical protein